MYMFQVVPSCLSLHNVNKGTLSGLLHAMFSAFLCFVLVILLFKMASKHKVLKCNKSVICLTEKTCIRVDQLHSGTSYSAVSMGFEVNESIRVSLNFKHINKVMYWLVDENMPRVSLENSNQLDSAQVPQTFFRYHHLRPGLLLHPIRS